jgi:uncharacterized protein with ParB-like and HNH nuclease domain
MKASETKLNSMIEGTKQYVVPLFQRPYSWGSHEWNELLHDLMSMNDVPDTQDHFMGSIVTMPTMSVPEGVSKYLLIDGQQRMTTLFILLILIRDLAKQQGQSDLDGEIQNTLLTNQYKRGMDKYKLLPTQVDRDSFFALVDGKSLNDESGIAQCYQFFAKKWRTTLSSSNSINALYQVISRKLSLVSIVLERDDNPYLVFESLNAKGKPLSQADLIRNYFFMRIHQDQQDEIYKKYWLPMFQDLGDSMTEFVRHFLMRDGRFVRESDVYDTIKVGVNEKNTLQYLEELRKNASWYNCILNPDKEQDIDIRVRLARIIRLEATIIYPFLLTCYGEYAAGSISKSTFTSVLDIIENFFIRRYLCNYRRDGLNRELPMLYRHIRDTYHGDYIKGLPALLLRRGYPSNEELQTAIASYPVYGSGSRLASTKLVLERIEALVNNRELVDVSQASIEHVMPQTLTDWWRNHLGDNCEVTHAAKLHVLGNLTLTAYNPTLSNKSYPEKRDIFVKSNFRLNRYFDTVTQWKDEDINARAAYMTDAVLKIWPDIRSPRDAQNSLNITYTKPYALRIGNQNISVKHWSNVLYQTVKYLYDTVDRDTFMLVPRKFPKIVIQRTNASYGQSFDEVFTLNPDLSANDVYQFCHTAIHMCGMGTDEYEIKRDLTRM